MLDSCRYLQQRGFDVTYLPVEKSGLVNMQQLADAIRPETSLVRGNTLLTGETAALCGTSGGGKDGQPPHV